MITGQSSGTIPEIERVKSGSSSSDKRILVVWKGDRGCKVSCKLGEDLGEGLDSWKKKIKFKIC